MITFTNALNEFDYQEFPSDPKQGDYIKTILIINEDFHIDLWRESHFTFWKQYRRKDRIVGYKAPKLIPMTDESTSLTLLETSNKEIFNQILESVKTTEVTDSFTLYAPKKENGSYVFYGIKEAYNGQFITTNKLNDTIVNQFKLNDLSDNINNQNPPNYDYKELVEKKAPALLLNQQNQTKGVLVFGVFEITNINPLTVKCVEYISNKHANELKKSVWRHWFSGFDLIYWIVFGILFSISFYFTIRVIRAILRGESIQ